MNSDNPSVPPSQIVVFVPVDGEDVGVVNNLRVRVFQTSSNDGKKVFWSYTQMHGSVGVPLTCATNADCDDGLFCDGVEVCTDDVCAPGTPVCDDGLPCTVDSCNEATDSCDSVPNDAFCDDGNACTDDVCDPIAGCVYSAIGPCLESFSLLVSSVFDNKNNKTFVPDGPDGSDPYDDLRTTAEEQKVEILGDDPTFYWESDYDNLPTGGTVSDVEVVLQIRREESAEGTLRIEVYSGGSLQEMQDVALSTVIDDTAAGVPTEIIVSVPSLDGQPVSAVDGVQVRAFIMSGNGKKVFWSRTELNGVSGN